MAHPSVRETETLILGGRLLAKTLHFQKRSRNQKLFMIRAGTGVRRLNTEPGFGSPHPGFGSLGPSRWGWQLILNDCIFPWWWFALDTIEFGEFCPPPPRAMVRLRQTAAKLDRERTQQIHCTHPLPCNCLWTKEIGSFPPFWYFAKFGEETDDDNNCIEWNVVHFVWMSSLVWLKSGEKIFYCRFEILKGKKYWKQNKNGKFRKFITFSSPLLLTSALIFKLAINKNN